ncbi:MerR family transcriptional regulator [Clostridium bowmanii]|uniref:MerR family transcriptional regulator n=1 Tax=Clostridium bowmanii TaxID=132925 RepID=UPI001C0AA928|nr:MerR family transcriptional regulator [Clostridium bowmanii]MBU3191820.1 MerR family transcriptional regulator [Clostridium bowmanii]MCA1076086.1 MerR family transcriptional regulator [Clostridium bowmanii]
MDTTYYKIEEVALKTGLTKRALRYYEDLKLIEPKRTDASYRLYTEEDIKNINRIKDLRESLGFCLKDVKVIMELGNDVKGIFNGDIKDNSVIDKSINQIKEQIALLEEKELSLINSKEKFQIALTKLEGFRHIK